MMKLKALSLCVSMAGLALVAPGTTQAIVADTIISTYVGGFNGNGNPGADSRWGYLWNAPAGHDPLVALGGPSGDGTTNPFGDPANYTALSLFSHPSWGDFYTPVTFWPVRGGADVASYSRMGNYDGQVAGGSGQTFDINNTHDRYMIASFDIDADGTYAITNSWLQVPDFGSSGIEVAVHVNNGPILSSVVYPGGTFGYGGVDGNDFDTLLGNLTAGDTVYVGFGPDGSDAGDFYIMDFAVSLVPEPASAAVLALGALAMIRRSR